MHREAKYTARRVPGNGTLVSVTCGGTASTASYIASTVNWSVSTEPGGFTSNPFLFNAGDSRRWRKEILGDALVETHGLFVAFLIVSYHVGRNVAGASFDMINISSFLV